MLLPPWPTLANSAPSLLTLAVSLLGAEPQTCQTRCPASCILEISVPCTPRDPLMALSALWGEWARNWGEVVGWPGLGPGVSVGQ